MPGSVTTDSRFAAGLDRVVGQVLGERPGATLLCTASLHGNEPAGLTALQRVFGQLHSEQPDVRGEFIGLVGNLAAVESGNRFVDVDLNRNWSPANLQRYRTEDPATFDHTEDREAAELLEAVDSTVARARGPVYFLDIHTTSGPSPPFVTLGDTLQNRRFSLQIPVPIVMGLEEQLDHTFLEYVSELGHISLGFEAGQHDDPASIEHAEDCVWIALVAAGVLSKDAMRPQLERAYDRLAASARGLPRVVEVRYRHPFEIQDRFRMKEGFRSLEPVRAGQVVGDDVRGPVRVPEKGRMLMPLYQEQGEDGFFIVREFRPAWLAISEWARRRRLHRFVRLLPGVQRHVGQADTLVIDRRIARWYSAELFHLLGYRKRRLHGDTLVVTRRRESKPSRS